MSLQNYQPYEREKHRRPMRLINSHGDTTEDCRLCLHSPDYHAHQSLRECFPHTPAVHDFPSRVGDLGDRYKIQAEERVWQCPGRLPLWEDKLRKTWRLATSCPDNIGGRVIAENSVLGWGYSVRKSLKDRVWYVCDPAKISASKCRGTRDEKRLGSKKGSYHAWPNRLG